MKKLLLFLALLMSINLFASEKKNHFAISSGGEYLEEFFFNFGVSSLTDLGESKELDIKLALNMTTTDSSLDPAPVTPNFNVPVKAGINFLFPLDSNLTFLAGVGVSSSVRLGMEEVGFLVGPNAKLGLRYKVHPSMSIFTEVCQSLLIGAPKWMYPSTEIILGVNFFI